MNEIDKDIFNIIEAKGLFSQQTLNSFLDKSKDANFSLYDYLVSSRMIDEQQFLQIISEARSMPLMNLQGIKIDKSVIEKVPARIAWHYGFLPLKIEDEKLIIAVSAPLSINLQDELKISLGCNIDMVLSKKSQIHEQLKMSYGLAADIVKQMLENSPDVRPDIFLNSDDNIESMDKLAGDANIINLVNQIIFEAYKKRATDIHIEPFKNKLRLRYRIDGILREQEVPQEVHRFIMPILSRIKVMGNLNIVERRIPQDGRATVKTNNEVFDLRISFMPASHGESVVIRMLQAKASFDISHLGLLKEDIDILRSLLSKKNGIIFLTGPTGSGKSTTLYSCLKEIDCFEKKVVTIEDPVEYEMENIIQVNVNTSTGLTFARGLRSMLRHDPDIIMVGEVRDKETAEIAIRVALTGHLVLSTLHTNDAVSGALRLIDIGIEPYLVSSSVEAFIAQRLIRLVCEKCRYKLDNVPENIKQSISEALNLNSFDGINIYKGKGCENCNFTGYYGRTAIYEILIVDDDIKTLIAKGASSSEISNEAIGKGMRTMIQHGWRKVIEGLTTIEEVLNACQYMTNKSSLGKNQQAEDPRRAFMRAFTRVYIKCSISGIAPGDILKINGTKTLEDGSRQGLDGHSFSESAFCKVPAVESDIDLFAATSNLSAGGALIESEYLFPNATLLNLSIYLPGIECITCQGKVLRSDKEGLPFYFSMALCFLGLQDWQKQAIDKFVKMEAARQNVFS